MAQVCSLQDGDHVRLRSLSRAVAPLVPHARLSTSSFQILVGFGLLNSALQRLAVNLDLAWRLVLLLLFPLSLQFRENGKPME